MSVERTPWVGDKTHVKFPTLADKTCVLRALHTSARHARDGQPSTCTHKFARISQGRLEGLRGPAQRIALVGAAARKRARLDSSS